MDILLNQIKKTWLLLFSLLGAFLFSSCVNEEHGDERGLSVALTWQDPTDKETEVKDVRQWIYAADGTLVANSQKGSAQEAASERFQLPEGEYQILTTTNLLPPFTLGTVTRAMEIGSNLRIGVNDNINIDWNAFFGITDVKVDQAFKFVVVENVLKGVLAQVEFQIEDMPVGAQLTGTVKNASKWIYPMLKDAEGGYGRASDEMAEVNFSVKSLGDALSNPILVMPTGNLQDYSLLQLRIALPDGTERLSEIKAPMMLAGGKYRLQLKYEEIQSNMTLSSVKIDDWTEEWVYYGEIFDPEE